MLKIGEFSKLSRVSIKILRHYDEIGLFKPAMTDPFTGYHYNREDQLITMGRICSLKEMGFSLSDIASITGEPMNRNVQKRFSQKLNKLEWDGSAAEKYFQETLFENPE